MDKIYGTILFQQPPPTVLEAPPPPPVNEASLTVIADLKSDNY